VLVPRAAHPALLDEPFTMVGYPLATVLAEKLVTMIAAATPRPATVTSPTSGY
jgi:hypothetical protein